MVKRTFLIALAFVFVMSMACTVYADDFLHKSVDKLAGGTLEIVKSPLVLPDHTMSEMDKAEHAPLGFFKGLLESPFHLVKKAGGGAMDVATFPLE